MEREGVCGGELQIPCVFRSFSRFGLPCNDWGLGCLGSSSWENQVERVVRLVVLIQQLVNMFDTLMFEHIVCWTQSERSKPGNLDHLHSLRLHCWAPWLAGDLLCHRVNRSKTIFTLTIFERVSSLVWVVLWFLLVADSPATVGFQILVFFLLRSQIFSTGIYLLRRRNTSWSP